MIFGVALLMILDLIGISLVPIIASARILGLAIGFGARSVVEDFLRGLFMLGEDQFCLLYTSDAADDSVYV